MRLASAALHEPRKQLEAFIDKMRAAAPFGKVDWDNAMWDLRTVLRGRVSVFTSGRARCCGSPSIGRPERRRQSAFAAPFVDFAKAIICARHLRSAQTIGAHRVSVRAERYLYDALRKDGLLRSVFPAAPPFRVGGRCCEETRKNQQRIPRESTAGGNCKVSSTSTPSQGCAYSSARRSRKVKQSVIVSKMPTRETLEALADISASNDVYNERGTLICMRIVDILAATGFRIGEALTLPSSPIVRRGDNIGLRYWPEKGGQLRIKTISSVHRDLVERAVADLTEACAEARRLARWCEENPSRVALPKGLPENMTSADFATLSLDDNPSQWLRVHKVPYRRQDRKIAFARKDLERALDCAAR